LKGFDVRFLTGTDEHGQTVEKSAAEAGVEPRELADKVVLRFQELWKLLNISNDDFIRTTDARHKLAVERIWKTVVDNGDIYLDHYEDWYCTPCEMFLTETQLINGKCPDCLRVASKLKEESYFFRLSKYGDLLLKHIEENPDFIQPKSRANEVKSFIKGGLRDLSVSRTTFSWGIPVPDNPEHVIYVWFDALTNYLSSVGYGADGTRPSYWPADLHMIGKDILRFHTVYWPAFLMSAGVELPKSVFAHGWWTVEGTKMSKSLGNVVDPYKIVEEYGVDQFRFFLLREVPFGLDGDFSIEALKGRINSDLANDLGNLLSRTLSMIVKYRGGVVPKPAPKKTRELESELVAAFDELPPAYDHFMGSLDFHEALERIWVLIRRMNAYVDKSAPWKEDDEEVLSNVLFTLATGLKILAPYLYPFMPESATEILARLGVEGGLKDGSFDSLVEWNDALAEAKVTKGAPLFPRVE
ncbi:MAG: methionine--tRNA ligase, partial [Thermodesulfobacteriota bacterium]